MVRQNKMIYDASNDPTVFPFASFYDTDQFLNQIQRIGAWCGLELTQTQPVLELHQQFLARQPYKDSKKFCDELMTRITNKEIFDLPKLDLMQESYISGQLENYYDCELPTGPTEWFTNSRQILNFFVK